LLKQHGKNLAIWVIIAVFLTALFSLYQKSPKAPMAVFRYSDFLSQVEKGNVRSVLIRGEQIVGQSRDDQTFQTYIPPQERELISKLLAHQVSVSAAPQEEGSPSLLQILLSWFPMLLLIGVWFFVLRQMQGGSGRAMGFGKSRARLLDEKVAKITFEDVAGIDEAKSDLQEIVDFLKSPRKFQKLGGRIPKGVLLVGPPGTGKTLLARAIAGEASVPFFSISGSDFVEMFVGVGASRVRDMFEQAKKHAPCIVFVDEIDAVGRNRGTGMGGGNDEREQTLNQLLVEMDGFESTEGVILIAATNRPDVLDPALLRPGRFDRQINVPNPDINGREKILLVHMKKVALSPNVNARVIARGTPGFSGADLANLVNEAALLAARRNKRAISLEDLEDAKDKVLMGAERKSMVMSEEERRITAYHESGHAIIAHYMPHSDPIHKATIVPRGHALGMVVRLPEKDHVSIPQDRLEADVMVAMGGRIAEQMIFGDKKITTGASSDIKSATNIVRHMVTEWGMSKEMGPIFYGDSPQEMPWMSHNRSVSEATAELIDKEVRSIIDACYKKAVKLLKEKKDELHLLAENLLERETLTGEDIATLLKEGKLNEKTQRVLRSALDPSAEKVTKPATSET
jgi:cell division protease FtsH